MDYKLNVNSNVTNQLTNYNLETTQQDIKNNTNQLIN